MKIIKQFEDPIFMESITWWAPTRPKKWIWGLGDDGLIYFLDKDSNWVSLKQHNATTIASCVAGSISTMKRLIKEFGHLVIFI